MTAWVFGKLPAHGDFVARGMDGATRGMLDDWLSGALVSARARYPGDFADRFDAAQPWLAAGDGVSGALAASQDAAGRRYPILLLTDGIDHDPAACEELLRSAIVEGWEVDRLAQVAGAPHGSVTRWTGGDGRALTGARPGDLIGEMLA